MVAGHLREKNGYFYAVLNYNDSLAQIARTSWTLPEDREERAPGHGGGRRPEPCPENFQKSRSEYSIEKGIE